jgi:monoamine oxidase
MKVAVIGGGPGGLMTARLLEQKSGGRCRVTLFEADSRLGGKIHTRRFTAAPVTYEAGVAECYDYEAFGQDPLKNLVRELALTVVRTHSGAVVLNGVLLRNEQEIAAYCGPQSWSAVERFRREAIDFLPLSVWRRGFTRHDNDHPWARSSFAEILEKVEDPLARRYLSIAIHSDMATEPHLTNGLIGLRNVLKNVTNFGAQYAIEGGMQRLTRQLAAHLTRTEVWLNSPVARVSREGEERLSVDVHVGRARWRDDFDAVVMAVPYNTLRDIEWTGERLQRAMARHVAHYDHAGHFLRISILFERPFWRDHFEGSWLMLDAFGGCCVYDERCANGSSGHGVLGWLLSGTDALLQSNADDATLVARAIDSLPDVLYRKAKRHVIEGKVHRWVGALSGTPGGFPLRDPRVSHQPEPIEHERLAMVGDYLFDSTLNGVLRSAEIATDIVLGGRAWRTAAAFLPALPALTCPARLTCPTSP